MSDQMTVKATLKSIEKVTKQKKDGGTYGAYDITYQVKSSAKPYKISVHESMAKGALGDALQTLQPDTMVELKIEKRNGFNNLIGLSELGSSASTTSSSNTITPNDARQESIVFQNALAHATAIVIHNAGKNQVKVEDIIKTAYAIAKVSLSPKIGKVSEVEKEVTETEYEDGIPF